MKCNICNKEMIKCAQDNNYTFYKCSDCGFYASQGWENMDYDDYETFDAELNKFDLLVEKAVEMLKYKFEIIGRMPKSFLDIGCSEGVWVKAFSKIVNEGRACGIEVSRQKVKRAKKLGLEVGNYEEIEGKFEFIYLRHVIEHISEPKEFINFIAEKYLQEGGVICIETPNCNNIGSILKGNKIIDNRFFKELYPPTHVVGYSVKTFKRIKGFKPLMIFTTAHNDLKWYFECEREHPIINKILTWVGMNTNIFVVLEKACN